MQHIGYVLLSYGAKHTSAPLNERPGAVRQMKRIERLVSRAGGGIGGWRVEHVRSPVGPRSFPILFATLAFAREQEAFGLVVLDDVAKLFRKLPLDQQQMMRTALEPFHPFLVDALRRKSLSIFSEEEWLMMLVSPPYRPAMLDRRPGTVGHRDSVRALERARHVSKQLADEFARPVFDLREEFANGGGAPSNILLARFANELGLRTSRGGFWSDVTVARAIRRIENAIQERRFDTEPESQDCETRTCAPGTPSERPNAGHV